MIKDTVAPTPFSFSMNINSRTNSATINAHQNVPITNNSNIVASFPEKACNLICPNDDPILTKSL